MDESVIFGLNGDDDDVGWGKNLGVVDNGGEVDDGKWLQEIIDCFEKKCDEYNKSLLVSSEVKGSSNEDDDDDDCVILDGDPYKADVEGENENVAVGDDSDELVVVKETGKVACRDYPHSREVCAKFPFASTPHVQYCSQCHCYVCDAPAPCLEWGTGVSISDHCNASGKVEFWNQQRQSLKKSHQSAVPVPKDQYTSMSTQPMQTNQAPASTPLTQYNIPPTQVPMSAPIPSIQSQTPWTQVPRPAPNTHIQYQPFQAQTPRPPLIWPSQTAAMNMPSIRGQSYAVLGNNLQLNLPSQQSRNTGDNALAGNRSHNVGSLGPQVPTLMFKRRGIPVVASASNQKTGHLVTGHGSTMYTRVPSAVSAPGNCNNMISAQKNGNSYMSRPSLQPHMQPMPSNIVAFQAPPQPRLISQLSAQSNIGNIFLYSTTTPQTPYQKAFGGEMSLRTVSLPQLPLQPTNSFGNNLHTDPPVFSQPSHASNNQQNNFQQENRTNNFRDTTIPYSGLNWLTDTTNPGSQQKQAQNSQLPASGVYNDPLPIGDFDFLFGGSSNTGSFDLNLGRWALNSEELARLTPGTARASATVDVGTLFG